MEKDLGESTIDEDLTVMRLDKYLALENQRMLDVRKQAVETMPGVKIQTWQETKNRLALRHLIQKQTKKARWLTQCT